MSRRRLALVVLVLALMGVVLLRPRAIPPTGLVEGRLRPCPDRPNCVCSQDDGASSVPPLTFDGDPSEALDALQALVLSMPRTALVARTERTLHVTFTTALLRFTDDVEFLVDPGPGLIHLRSASRVGYSDLGTNRRRALAIAEAWSAHRAAR